MSYEILDNEELKKQVKEASDMLKSLNEEAVKIRNNAIAAVGDQYVELSKTLDTLIRTLAEGCETEIQQVIDKVNELLAALKTGEYDASFATSLDISEEKFNWLRGMPEIIKKIEDETVNADKGVKKLGDTFKSVADNLKIIFGGTEDKTKSKKEAWKELATDLKKINVQAKEVGDSISTMLSAFGSNNFASEMATNITGLITGVGQTATGAAKLAAGDITGIADVVGGIGQTIASIAKLGDSVKEKQIKKLQDEFDALTAEMRIFDRDIAQIKWQAGKSYSKEKSDLIEKENEQLGKKNEDLITQQQILRDQIQKEGEKKKTDDKKIKEWEKQLDTIESQIEANKRQIEDNKNAAIDALFGQDIKNAIDNFAKAYADAWAGGADKAKSMQKVVRDMIRSYVLEMIKGDKSLQKTIAEIREKIDEYLKDGILDATEQSMLDNIIKDAADDLDRKYGGIMNIFKDDEEGETRKASAQGFAAMTQDSANELNGRFTAIQAHTFEMNENLKSMVAAITQDSANELNGRFTAIQIHTSSISENMKMLLVNSGQVLNHLAGIESNTKYCENLKDINKNIASVKSGIDNIQLRGITIRN